MSIRSAAFVGVVAIVLQGCASIVSGSTETVSVETKTPTGAQVVGANCRMTNDKGTWFVATPGTVPVHRSYDDLTLICTKEGFEPATDVEKSSTKGMAFGNILFGGLIGTGVDVASGAAYDYPPLISILMKLPTEQVPISSSAPTVTNASLAVPVVGVPAK